MADAEQVMALSHWSNRALSHTSEDGLLEISRRGAVIIGDYRYLLWRTWDGALPRMLWVMLNPSTADETTNDATITRCVGFSKVWGYGGLDVVNLFALRATRPSTLRQVADPIGPENDRYITQALSRAGGIVVAWGEHGGFLGRDRAVLERLAQHATQALYCIGVTKNGSPRHPLYVAGSTRLRAYNAGAR